jgi:5-bromo-4-chloroindolyl phosphate hydrolysis protein
MKITRTFQIDDQDAQLFKTRLCASKYNLWKDAMKQNKSLYGFINLEKINENTYQVSSLISEETDKFYNILTFIPNINFYYQPKYIKD